MKLSICADSMSSLSYEDMLDKVKGLGIDYVEMTVGGWSPAPHICVDELLGSEEKLSDFKKALTDREMGIAALICFGNPLYPGKLGEEHSIAINKTLELAKVLGVKKIITMSGLPAASADEKIPLWITYNVSLPQYLQDVMKYQWEEVAIPYWKRVVKKAKACGVEKIALENFTSMLVYNPKTLLKLRDAVDPMIGLNLDPSHLMFIDANPTQSARALGDAIHHIHKKDVRIERCISDVNDLLQWWKEFFSVVKTIGYDEYVCIELECLTTLINTGINIPADSLKQAISI